MRDAQNTQASSSPNLSLVKAPPVWNYSQQAPPIMGAESNELNHYFEGITHTAPIQNINALGFSDPTILAQALANNYNYDAELERAQAAENLKMQQIRQQQALRAAGQEVGQTTAQNARNLMLAQKPLVKKPHPRGKTLAEIAGEITGHHYHGKLSFDAQRALDLKRLARELQRHLPEANRKALSVVQARQENTQTKAPGHDHDADYNANTAYGFMLEAEDRLAKQEQEKEQRENARRAFEEKISNYPKGVVYMGYLDFKNAYYKWIEGKTKAVVVDMSTINFNASIPAAGLVKNQNYSLPKAMKEMIKSNELNRDNIVVTDVAVVPSRQKAETLNDYLSYRALGVNLIGSLSIDKGSKTWNYKAQVYPNGAYGYYQNRKDLPVLDKFDVNDSSFRADDENFIFKTINNAQKATGIGTDYPIIADTYKDKGQYRVKPGEVYLQGKIPDDIIK